MAVSRRHLFKSAITLAGTVGLGSLATRSLAADSGAPAPTVAQKNAFYQEQPKGQQRCSLCTHFVAPSSCRVVMGTISPNGWCRLFAPSAQ